MVDKEKDAKLAKRMLERADKILQSVDESYIITERHHKFRLMPVFRPEEISLGTVLGTGGFGVVNEISKFTLDDELAADKPDDASGDSLNNDSVHPNRVATVVSNLEDAEHNSHVHYDIKKAKFWMKKRCLRNGTARYAIKRLHGDLSQVEKARGMVDLALEAKYLSVVWHPNISTLLLHLCTRFGIPLC